MTEELVDLVDKDGNVVAAGVPREVVRRNEDSLAQYGLYMPIVLVVLVDERLRVVAHVRSLAKGPADGGGDIDLVCGAVSSGEGWREASEREALEEIGVRLQDAKLIRQSVNSYQRYEWLVAARTTDTPQPGDPDEVSELVVGTLPELEELARRGTPFVRDFFEVVALGIDGLFLE